MSAAEIPNGAEYIAWRAWAWKKRGQSVGQIGVFFIMPSQYWVIGTGKVLIPMAEWSIGRKDWERRAEKPR